MGNMDMAEPACSRLKLTCGRRRIKQFIKNCVEVLVAFSLLIATCTVAFLEGL